MLTPCIIYIFRSQCPSIPPTKSQRGHRYCCVPQCHNTTATLLPNDVKVTLHRIPANTERRRTWIQALRTVRQNLVVNDNTRICSAHFIDCNTERHPTIFPSKQPKPAPTPRYPKDRTPLQDLASIVNPVLSDEEFPSCSSPSSTKSSPFHSESPKQFTDTPWSVDIGIQCTPTTCDASTQTSAPDITLDELHTDEKARFYTGFCNVQMMMLMFTTLVKHGADKLNYWRGETSLGQRSYHQHNTQKPGPKRALRLQDEFLLTCMRLQLGLLQEHLGDIFKVSSSTVSRVLNTWINFIYNCSQSLVPWPTKEQILYNLPRAFMDFPNTQIVLDCTELFIEKPSSHVAQWQTWSEYKHNNTLKPLVGVTPNGTVTFVSRLWGGRASDRHITMNEDVLARIDPGMTVMADKGFTIDDLLSDNVHLNVPPKIPSARPMTEEEVFKTAHIASARIVI